MKLAVHAKSISLRNILILRPLFLILMYLGCSSQSSSSSQGTTTTEKFWPSQRILSIWAGF